MNEAENSAKNAVSGWRVIKTDVLSESAKSVLIAFNPAICNGPVVCKV